MADFRVGVSTLAGPDTFEAPAAIIPTSPLPKMQYLVALNNGPLDDPASITGIATPAGTVGGFNVWTDLTDQVEICDIIRGRQHELGRFEAGTCTLTVSNVGGAFNTWNTTGPYFNKLGPMRLLQVRARVNTQTYYRFTGYVTAVKPVWDDPVGQQKAMIEAKDAFNRFNQILLGQKSYTAQVIADGPSHYWRMNEAAGAVAAADSVGGVNGLVKGNGQSVTFGSPGPLASQPDTAASLPLYAGQIGGTAPPPGTGQAWIDVTGGAIASVPFSAEAWIKLVTPNIDNVAFISQAASPSAVDIAWDFRSQLLSQGAIFSGTVGTPGGIAFTAGPNIKSGDGLWHHVVLTYDGTNFIVYVDTTPLTTAQNPAPVLGAGQTCLLGVYSDTTVTYHGSVGGFNLSQVAFYPYVLSAAQVTNHFKTAIVVPTGTSGAQIGTVLDSIGWAAGARNIDAGVQQCQRNTQNLQNTSALTFIQLDEQTEGGALFMTGDGKVRFISRQNIAQGQQYGNVQAWFGDDVQNPATVGTWDVSKWGQSTWGTLSIPYQPGPDMGLDELDIVNQQTVTRVGGQAQTANDLVSQNGTGNNDGYGLRTGPTLSGLLHLSDAASLAHAKWIVAKLAQPLFRMRTLHVNLVDVLYDTSKLTRLLGLDLMHRVKVNRYQVGFEQVGLIEHWEEKITADSWDIVIAMSPTDTYRYWEWGGAQ